MIEFNIVDKTIGLCAKRGSGKSQMLHYIIEVNKHLFKRVFIICPTEKISKFYEDIIPKENIFDSYSEKWVENLIKLLTKHNENKTKHNADRVLLILDDCCSDTNFHQSKSLKTIFCRGRLFFLSLILTSQYLFGGSGIPPVFRNNLDFLLVNKINGQSLESLTKEFRNGNISKEKFISMYNNSTGNYGFLLINNVSSEGNDDLDSIYGIIRVPKQYIK